MNDKPPTSLSSKKRLTFEDMIVRPKDCEDFVLCPQSMIDRLRDDLQFQRNKADSVVTLNTGLEQERDRLRAALTELMPFAETAIGPRAAPELARARRALSGHPASPSGTAPTVSDGGQAEAGHLENRLRTLADEVEAGRFCVEMTDEAEIALLRQAASTLGGRQARIDALMLEFCPDEMTPAQKENWARHQVSGEPRLAHETSGEPEAWLFHCWKPGSHMTFATVQKDDSNWWPRDQWKGVTRVALVTQGAPELLYGEPPPSERLQLKANFNAHCNACGQDYEAIKGHSCPAYSSQKATGEQK